MEGHQSIYIEKVVLATWNTFSAFHLILEGTATSRSCIGIRPFYAVMQLVGILNQKRKRKEKIKQNQTWTLQKSQKKSRKKSKSRKYHTTKK